MKKLTLLTGLILISVIGFCQIDTVMMVDGRDTALLWFDGDWHIEERIYEHNNILEFLEIFEEYEQECKKTKRYYITSDEVSAVVIDEVQASICFLYFDMPDDLRKYQYFKENNNKEPTFPGFIEFLKQKTR